ncbi:hypothetical protein BH20ACT17_BH20ACT17_06040 [soil metagenome]
MRPSQTTRFAVGAFLVLMLIMGVVVLTTSLRVEDFGPVIVFGLALVSVGVLLRAPRDRGRVR